MLHDISLQIEEGERVVILGPNGCGKSTLLKTITCELYPVPSPATRVSVLGRERWDLTELKQRLGVVQQELPGKPILRCTGEEAVLTGFFSSSTLWPHFVVTGEMRHRASDVLHQIGAQDLGTRIFGEMSAGQRRRILIGRALVASASCLLLDEPSTALDLHAHREFTSLLSRLARGNTTILHITHHVSDIIPEVGRVIFLRQGRIIEDGPPARLLTGARLSDLFSTKVHLEHAGGRYHAW